MASGVASSSNSASALIGDAAAAAAQNDEVLPAHLLQVLKDARPPCPFYSTKRGCRKGRKCKLSHGSYNEAHIPHISRHVSETGSTYITLRPPLMKGLECFFEDRKVPIPISNGQTWRLADGTSVVTFATHLMEAPDMFVCSEAQTRGFASNGEKKFYASSRAFSGFILHSTSVPNAMNILLEGRIRPSPGICGHGVYGFEAASQEHEALDTTWQRGVAGGYCWGAAFLLKCHGIVINCSYDQTVPPGSVAHKNDQFAVADKSATYVSVTFARDALVGAIGKEMDTIGYSQQLHSALLEVQKHFDSRAPGQLPDSAKLLSNAVVLKHDKGRVRTKPLQQQDPSTEAGPAASKSHPPTPAATPTTAAAVAATTAAVPATSATTPTTTTTTPAQWPYQDWQRQHQAQYEWQHQQLQHAATAHAIVGTSASASSHQPWQAQQWQPQWQAQAWQAQASWHVAGTAQASWQVASSYQLQQQQHQHHHQHQWPDQLVSQPQHEQPQQSQTCQPLPHTGHALPQTGPPTPTQKPPSNPYPWRVLANQEQHPQQLQNPGAAASADQMLDDDEI